MYDIFYIVLCHKNSQYKKCSQINRNCQEFHLTRAKKHRQLDQKCVCFSTNIKSGKKIETKVIGYK